jgi:hypothetical protein
MATHEASESVGLVGPLCVAGAGFAVWNAGSAGAATTQAQAAVNRIPDFSRVGYHGGDAPIPMVAARRVGGARAPDAAANLRAAAPDVIATANAQR